VFLKSWDQNAQITSLLCWQGMSKKQKPEIINLPEGKLDEISSRLLTTSMSDDDKKIILTILTTYAWLTRQLRSTKLTINRLKSLFGFTTEKHTNKKKKKKEEELPEGLNSLPNLPPAEDTGQDGKVVSIKKKPKWHPDQNHGRIGAKQYEGCPEVILSHPTLTIGSACPDCAACNTKGTLGADTLQIIVRLEGNPLITGTRYVAPCLRCNTCQTRFKTPIPDEIKNAPKYDVSCATTLAIARYSLGLPMKRTETNQAMHGIPMKDATQWDLLRNLHDIASPVHAELTKQASDGTLMVYDDTPGRMLTNQAQGLATHTTAFISVYEEHKIHLFITGRNHAGNNADAILANRTNEEPVVAMMDASPNNIPKHLNAKLAARFILCFCLVHGRRKFFEVFDAFDKECDFVLNIIGLVYANDAHCKQSKLSPEERLIYHQTHSQPLMDALRLWLHNQRAYELSEPNSGLGEAVRYMLRHWVPLTTFLRVAGALLDSSWAERAIKIAIRHRRNSLFYKTPKGAQVGDCLMSLIYTCTQNDVNPYDYLNTLQRHGSQVKAGPSFWLPWNYVQTMATVNQAQAA